MSKSRLIIVVLLVVTALGAALWWLDFQLSSSESRAQSQTSMATGGRRVEEKVPRVTALGLYVQWAGDAGQARALQQDLARSLPSELGLASVEAVEVLPETLDRPVLMVEVHDANVAWIPVYSHASLAADFAYASDGATAWHHELTVVMPPNPPGPVVRSQGTVTVDDTTHGLISRPAYLGHLRKQLAASLSICLRPVLAPPAGQTAAE